ncbi:hypothetical protein GGI20_001602 [Coemansia sp. BCRC 34301]|nr:hypothetical protein GGI20_001602 [Coemansia sp. BCRC 34301]
MAVCHLALILALLVVSHTASGAQFGSWPSINSYRGAVLFKNGQQTSCELALIDQSSAFIAASCIPGSTTQYEIFFESSRYQKASSSLVSAVHMHPGYDATTYANNIAVVTFTMDGKWTNAVSVNRDEWTDALFVRRFRDDGRWRAPVVDSGAWGGFQGCALSSGIYASNQRDFLCSSQSAQGTCGLPFGSAYGVVIRDMATAALHSHSVVRGDTLCGAGESFHYYTVLAGYVGFARSVLGYDVKFFTASGDFSTPVDGNYRMQPQAFGIPKGLRLFAGDVYAPGPGVVGTDEGGAPPPPPSPPPLPPPVPPTLTPSVSPTTTAPTTAGTSSTTTSSSSRRPAASRSVGGSRAQDVATDNNAEPLPPTEQEEEKGTGTSQTLGSSSRKPTNGGNAGMLTGGGGPHDQGEQETLGESSHTKGNVAANNISEDDEDGGLASGQIVAIGIFVPIAVIGMLCGAYYGLRWWRKRRLEKSWSAGEVRQMVDTQMTENELGLANNNFQLPSYRDYGGTMLIATSPEES